jgi:hypothetical protein
MILAYTFFLFYSKNILTQVEINLHHILAGVKQRKGNSEIFTS